VDSRIASARTNGTTNAIPYVSDRSGQQALQTASSRYSSNQAASARRQRWHNITTTRPDTPGTDPCRDLRGGAG
jgi:hypothetical protein